jgi:hypothetical protein
MGTPHRVHHTEWLTANAVELAGVVVEAARVYTELRLARAVVRTARAAAQRSDPFLKALAGAVVKAGAGVTAMPCKLNQHEMYGLLMLARVAVQRLDAAAAKKAVSKLVEVQAMLADALVASGVRWRVRVAPLDTTLVTELAALAVLPLRSQWTAQPTASLSAPIGSHIGSCSEGRLQRFCKQCVFVCECALCLRCRWCPGN